MCARKGMISRGMGQLNFRFGRTRWTALGLAASLACGFIFVVAVMAQQAGPIRPPTPPAGTAPVKPAATDAVAPATPAPAPAKQTRTATLPPPTMPMDEMIKKFAAREAEFKAARGNY